MANKKYFDECLTRAVPINNGRNLAFIHGMLGSISIGLKVVFHEYKACNRSRLKDIPTGVNMAVAIDRGRAWHRLMLLNV